MHPRCLFRLQMPSFDVHALALHWRRTAPHRVARVHPLWVTEARRSSRSGFGLRSWAGVMDARVWETPLHPTQQQGGSRSGGGSGNGSGNGSDMAEYHRACPS